MKRPYHLALTASLLGVIGIGHASSAYNFISSSVDTVVKVENNNSAGIGLYSAGKQSGVFGITQTSYGAGVHGRAIGTNIHGVFGEATSTGSNHWLLGVKGRAESSGGTNVWLVGTHGAARGNQTDDQTHGVYAEANNGSNNNWAVKAVANAEGGNRAVGGYFEGMNGVSYNSGMDAVGTGGTEAYGGNVLAQGGSNYTYGLNSVAYGWGSSYTSYGVKSYADGGYNDNYGVYAEAYGGYNATGVFGTAGGSTNDKAGLFIGDVLVTGTCTCWPSDEKLKKNVRPLEKGLSTVMALKPKAYDMKVDEYKDQLSLAKGPQMGVIAQEAEKVVPEAVRPVHIPARTSTKNGKTEKIDAIDYKTVDYVALIPVLIKAIQEQQAKIEALEARAK